MTPRRQGLKELERSIVRRAARCRCAKDAKGCAAHPSRGAAPSPPPRAVRPSGDPAASRPPSSLSARPLAAAYDIGAPIRLEYGAGGRGPIRTDAPACAAMAFDTSDAPFHVEQFEEDGPVSGPSPVSPGAIRYTPSPLPIAGAPGPRTPSGPVPPSASIGDDTSWLSGASRAPDAAEFESEIRDILSGKRRVEPPLPPLSDPRPAQQARSSAQAAPPPAPSGADSHPHSVFDRMGHNMAYATTFDVGTVELTRRLDGFEHELRAARPSAPARAAARPATARPPGEVDDIDVVSQLGVMEVERPMPGLREHTRPVVHASPRPAPMSGDQSFDVRHDVPLVPQLTGMSCWAAGAAMLVAWKHRMSVDPSEIARAAGHWAPYAAGLHPEDTTMFAVWGLTPEPAQSYTVEGFRALLERHGPLWAASAEPGPHIRVVTGLSGDGTPDGTSVHINDPWQQGMTTFAMPNTGSRTTETYSQFVAKQETLARGESHLQGISIAHM